MRIRKYNILLYSLSLLLAAGLGFSYINADLVAPHAPARTVQRITDIPLPDNFVRIKTRPSTFQRYLQNITLKPKGSPVYLYNGSLKSNQKIHYAVLNISVGEKNLQQCADAIMRLRAEYFFGCKHFHKIHFKLTNGYSAPFTRWAKGYRPKVKKNKITWIKRRPKSYSHKTLLQYLTFIYAWAGTYSLSRELQKVNIKDIRIGDIFIQGGFPGHAIIVMDMAIHRDSPQDKIILLAQSYMPAQNIHILKNPVSEDISPWYTANIQEKLFTPEWEFTAKDLKRFR